MTRRSLLVVAIIGLFLAAIIHIGILLFAPRLSVNDAWDALAMPLDTFVAYPARPMQPGDALHIETIEDNPILEVPIKDLDPQFSHAICRFDLRTGPVHLRTEGLEGFWTLNLFSAGGISFFSTNEQVNAGKPLNLLVATPQQVASMRTNNSASLDNLVLVETDIEDAAVLFRVYREHQVALPDTVSELQTVFFCTPFQQNPLGSFISAEPVR
uniref:DUF1254 domain-containing protein n=1 Tax=Pararhizobium sp. IMCC3301 TaxID=3067904 RepID=UPI002741E621|nr:hypothetical protein [Pararhizobium sp. IMCC3301]